MRDVVRITSEHQCDACVYIGDAETAGMVSRRAVESPLSVLASSPRAAVNITRREACHLQPDSPATHTHTQGKSSTSNL